MNRKSLGVVTVMLISAGAAAGCKQVVRMLTRGSPGQAAAVREAQPVDPEAEKLQPYIKCLNDFSSRVVQGREAYFETVDPETGPTGKENAYKTPHTFIQDPKTCQDAVAAVASKSPRLPELEAAGAELAAVFIRLGPLLKTVDTYYEQGNYKDDKLAKGKALHKQLMTEWAAFSKADHALRSQVKTINRKGKERELAQLEKTEGRKLTFHAQNALFQAEPVVELGDVEDVKDLPLDRYMPLVTRAERAIMDLDDYATAHADEVQKLTRFSSLVGSAKTFLAAAKELGRRVRDKTPYGLTDKMAFQHGMGQSVAGSPAQLVYRYNEMVKTANDVL